MKMRHFKGKQILSVVREGDYAHVGEEEAIHLIMNRFSKDAKRLILDVGCGLGGTAKFIQEHGWGQVTGVDIEEESIAYARKTYPGINFVVGDAATIDDVLSNKFDLICIFGSFVLFADQLSALKALRKLAHAETQLMVFDYIDRGGYVDPVPPFEQLHFPEFEEILKDSGWRLTSVENQDAEFEQWYMNLLNKIVAKENKIIKLFGKEAYDILYKRYSLLLQAMQDKKLGGGIVYANACNCI